MIAPLEQCPACDYDLRGLPSAHRCPECGFAYDERTRIWRLSRPPKLWRQAVMEVLTPISLILIVSLFKQRSGVPLWTIGIFLGIMAALWFAWRGWEYLTLGAQRPYLVISPAGLYLRASTKSASRLVPWEDFLAADRKPSEKDIRRQLDQWIAQSGGRRRVFENSFEEQTFRRGVCEAVERAAGGMASRR